jgi:DNA adenine methylase
MAMTKDEDPRPSRLRHFTPLRYPGGKGKLASYVKDIIRQNDLADGDYVEPYAGGAAIALELLLQEYVTKVHINDISFPVFSFWHSVLHDTDNLIRRVIDTPLTVDEWDRQKAIFKAQERHSPLDVGFATFYLNRTNRSGILNAGVIGGRDQSGNWKIDARFNARELAFRIESIANVSSRICLTNLDAVEFLREGTGCWPSKTLIYLDPPYYEKGRHLYYDFYNPSDHRDVASLVKQSIQRQSWIVSYDDVTQIHELYDGHSRIQYTIGYSARSTRQGAEVMFFSDGLKIPPLSGPLQLVGGQLDAA